MADICRVARVRRKGLHDFYLSRPCPDHSVIDHNERTDEVSMDILFHNCDYPQVADLDLSFSFALEILTLIWV